MKTLNKETSFLEDDRRVKPPQINPKRFKEIGQRENPFTYGNPHIKILNVMVEHTSCSEFADFADGYARFICPDPPNCGHIDDPVEFREAILKKDDKFYFGEPWLNLNNGPITLKEFRNIYGNKQTWGGWTIQGMIQPFSTMPEELATEKFKVLSDCFGVVEREDLSKYWCGREGQGKHIDHYFQFVVEMISD